jgi:hypothetical protein
MVIGSAMRPDDLPRALFYLRALAVGRFAPAGDEVGDADIQPDAKWALLLPGVSYKGTRPVMAEDGFSIVRIQ